MLAIIHLTFTALSKKSGQDLRFGGEMQKDLPALPLWILCDFPNRIISPFLLFLLPVNAKPNYSRCSYRLQKYLTQTQYFIAFHYPCPAGFSKKMLRWVSFFLTFLLYFVNLSFMCHSRSYGTEALIVFSKDAAIYTRSLLRLRYVRTNSEDQYIQAWSLSFSSILSNKKKRPTSPSLMLGRWEIRQAKFSSLFSPEVIFELFLPNIFIPQKYNIDADMSREKTQKTLKNIRMTQ